MIVIKNIHRAKEVLDSVRKSQGDDVADTLDIHAEQHLMEHLKDYFFKYGFQCSIEETIEEEFEERKEYE